MSAFVHICETWAEFGKCRCFDDIAMVLDNGGDWFYWHDGKFTKGQGPAPPVGTKLMATGEKR